MNGGGEYVSKRAASDDPAIAARLAALDAAEAVIRSLPVAPALSDYAVSREGIYEEERGW